MAPTAFPARGQKAPMYWDDQLKAYIDETATAAAVAASGAGGTATDAQLRDRATHTGTQTSSTISDFEVASEGVVAAMKGTATDAEVRDRATHTGTQSLSTTVDSAASTGRLAMTTAERTKLASLTVPSGGVDPISVAPAGTTITVAKDPTTGFWPSGYAANGTATYTGGSSSAGVRPTSRADIAIQWKGADPSPGVVTTGTAGMRDMTGGAIGDMRLVTP